MITYLNCYSKDTFAASLNNEKEAILLGRKLKFLSSDATISSLSETKGNYVLLGIKGDQTSWELWQSCLFALTNMRQNALNHIHKIIVLGHLDFSKECESIAALNLSKKENRTKLHNSITAIDNELTHVIYTIRKAGKKPIIVSDNQWYSYGIIKGCSLANNKALNVLNFSAFPHFSSANFRNKQNSFSYAYANGFLKKYHAFGLHENQVSKKVLDKMTILSEHVNFTTIETIEIRKEIGYQEALNDIIDFIAQKKFGIDLNIPVFTRYQYLGLPINEVRNMLLQLKNFKKNTFLHLSRSEFDENLPQKNHEIGSVFATFIMDYTKK